MKNGSGKYDPQWWCGVELAMAQMLPTYSLEKLQDTDIDLLFPLYFWYCKQFEKSNNESHEETGQSGEIVYRNGKPYRVRKNASWA